MKLDVQLLEKGGRCPQCGRDLQPLRTVASYLASLLTTSMAQTTARAQVNQWSSEVIAERLLSELRPLYAGATRELKCLAGICGEGGDTWG